MIPPEARDIYFYYGGVIFLSLLLFLLAGRKRKGMRLRLRAGQGMRQGALDSEADNVIPLHGQGRGDPSTAESGGSAQFSHVQPPGERPLNVVFNYNGHSWDAYEVLGLPAGSSMEKVEQAYRESVASVDAGSRSFMEAAYQAIHLEWKSYKTAGRS